MAGSSPGAAVSAKAEVRIQVDNTAGKINPEVLWIGGWAGGRLNLIFIRNQR
jgi:hypothetical protein